MNEQYDENNYTQFYIEYFKRYNAYQKAPIAQYGHFPTAEIGYHAVGVVVYEAPKPKYTRYGKALTEQPELNQDAFYGQANNRNIFTGL